MVRRSLTLQRMWFLLFTHFTQVVILHIFFKNCILNSYNLLIKFLTYFYHYNVLFLERIHSRKYYFSVIFPCLSTSKQQLCRNLHHSCIVFFKIVVQGNVSIYHLLIDWKKHKCYKYPLGAFQFENFPKIISFIHIHLFSVFKNCRKYYRNFLI